MTTLASNQAAPSDAETPLAYRVVRGGLWVALSSYWTIGFGFLTTLVMTRLLPPEAFGVFALATFFAQLFNLRSKIGAGYAFAHHKETNGQAIGTFLTLEVGAGLASLILIGAAVPILLSLGHPQSVVAVAAALSVSGVLEGVMGAGITLLDKEMRFGRTSLITAIVFPVSYVPALWLATHGGGYWSLVAQNVTFNILLLISAWWTARRQLPHLFRVRWQFDQRLARQFLTFGALVGFAMLAGLLLTQFDNFLIGTFVGLSVLGFYDRAYRTAEWPSKLLNALISRAAFYTYAQLQEDYARLQKTVTMLLWLVTMFALPLALVLFITAPDLIHLLYGPQWLPSAPFLRFLVIYAIARTVLENTGSLFIAIGQIKLNAIFVAIEALVLIVTGIPLTLLWGAIGTALAVGLAFGTGCLLANRYLTRVIALNLASLLGVPAIVWVLTVAGYLVINRATALNDLSLVARLVAKSVYAVAAFFLLTYILRPAETLERAAYVWRLVLAKR